MATPASQEPPRPDEPDWEAQASADDLNIRNLLNASEAGGAINFSFDEDTPFDQTNKADDALDFEDISDDDLPEEEEAHAANSLSVPGLTDDGGTSNDTDDLFGDGDGPSSPVEPVQTATSPGAHIHDPDSSDAYRELNFNPDPSSLATNQDPSIPPPPVDSEELVKQAWPTFETGVILKWHELLPPKKAYRKEKKPGRKPKCLITSKLTLELAPDQEKAFRVPAPATSNRKQRLAAAEARGLVDCSAPSAEEKEEEETFDLDVDDDSEAVGGFTLQDIETVCDDWAMHIDQTEAEFEAKVRAMMETEKPTASGGKRAIDNASDDEAESDEEWDALYGDKAPSPPRKKPRLPVPDGLPDIARFMAPSFDKFQEMTKRGAKRVLLDMNDPYLVLEENASPRGPKRQRTEHKLIRMADGRSRPDIFQRFNLSNDEAYELLKENHQHKVRATLGNLDVEHSMPALRLTWPYYKVKLDIRRRGYHRPDFKFGKYERQTVRFDRLTIHKRKSKKGKAHEIFKTTKDLGLTDNATAVLFEYCERTPPVLSNFGMGNRVINYYRKRKFDDDELPPKLSIGESHVLHPEDRSPFAIFGEVNPGQTVPTLHNQMYRAPIFKHKPRPTDFLCVKSSTGVEGAKWFLHNIDHLYVVGQTFPSVEIPGPHSRKVTNASKNRIKMVSYRLIRKSDKSLANMTDITKHIADSTDAQNRQKLKEFLSYANLGKGLWGLKAGEKLMTEDAIRAMIKPEDVCLIDGMQLGMQKLEDAGFDPNNVNLAEDNEEVDDDNDDRTTTAKGGKKPAEKGDDRLNNSMAPWVTSKAFIEACAGKAMLKLHGEGDPTGHGLGFSFIRTSMKGGYIETVQKGGSHTTAADAMAAHPDAMRKAYGGHAYNVKEQDAMYKKGIREIWEKQKASLEDGTEQDDSLVVPLPADEDDRFNTQVSHTPATHLDEGASQITGLTSGSRSNRRTLRITREVRGEDGAIEERTVTVDDPVVIAKYIKQRRDRELEQLNIYEGNPTGHMVEDRRKLAEITKELDRLNRNKARRKAREYQKGIHQPKSGGDAGSPEPDKAATGTSRKCNNCGQVGHIRTNKKSKPSRKRRDDPQEVPFKFTKSQLSIRSRSQNKSKKAQGKTTASMTASKNSPSKPHQSGDTPSGTQGSSSSVPPHSNERSKPNAMTKSKAKPKSKTGTSKRQRKNSSRRNEAANRRATKYFKRTMPQAQPSQLPQLRSISQF